MNQPDPSHHDPASVVIKSIIVARDVEGAFHVWTEQIAAWWPVGHSRSGAAAIQVFLEGKVGGRFYERTSTGVEHDWGKVVIWQPPYHLAYTWYLGSGPDHPTHVDVRFTALSATQTRIEVEHRGPELIGDLWGRNQARYSLAWDTVLPAYAMLGQSLTGSLVQSR